MAPEIPAAGVPLPIGLVTLLTCMAVDDGPTDCPGCFVGVEVGRLVEFRCNECGRVAFVAERLEEVSADAS